MANKKRGRAVENAEASNEYSDIAARVFERTVHTLKDSPGVQNALRKLLQDGSIHDVDAIEKALTNEAKNGN